MAEIKTYRVRIALFMHGSDYAAGTDPWLSAFKYHEHNNGTVAGWTRVTEWQTVEFQALSTEEVVVDAVRSIDAEIATVARELGEKLAKLNDRKAKLLALTHQPEQPAPERFGEVVDAELE